MRIAMLGHRQVPAGAGTRSGGVEVVVEELSVRLSEAGYNVTCYNRNEKDAKPVSEFNGVKVKRVPTIDKKGLGAASSSFFASLFAAFGHYDIVHIHAEGPAIMCWLPKLFGKRTVVTIHGLNHECAKWGRFAKWYIRCGERNAARFADEIIVLNKNNQQYFMDKYGRETHLIPNGVNIPAKFPAKEISERWGLEKGSYILFLSRLTPEKGIHYLIQAYQNIKTDKKLMIVGASADTEEYVEILKAMAADDPRIIFTGFVSGRAKEELFSNAYFFVIPSETEGMPLSLLEALSYDCCSLVSDIPGCLELVGDRMPSFRSGEVMSLRDKMVELCSDPALTQKYADNAHKIIDKGYSWDSVIDQLVEVYKGLK